MIGFSIAVCFYAITISRLVIALLEVALWYTFVISTAKRRTKPGPEKQETIPGSLVCATHNCDPSLAATINTWLVNKPYEIIICASPSAFEYVSKLCGGINTATPIKVIQASMANKRVQLCQGFRIASMPVIVAVDDDTCWTPGLLAKLINPIMNRPELGCVFPDLRLRVSAAKSTVWERLALLRHAAAGVNLHGSHYIDGGLYCHHGPTSAYRAEILKDEELVKAFSQETWSGIRLNNGDDQFLCRWLERRGWETQFLPVYEGTVYTSTRSDWTLLLQLLRWSRGDWRSNLNALIWERIWTVHPYTAFVRFDWCMDAFLPIVEIAYAIQHPSLFNLLLMAASQLPRSIPQVLEEPSLFTLLPAFILYRYAHSFIKIYALASINEPKWL